MNRLCIYVTYDKQNIVDRYIGYMLKELKTCVSHLVVVCNMPEIARGKEYIDAYADEVFFRENIGFDAGAFKDALCQLVGWDKVLEYDELVLVNDSFFGPFVPMQDIFAQMQEKDCDFWGIMKHSTYRDDEKMQYIPEHIQSYFLVVRNRMLHDASFFDFWKAMSYSASFNSVVKKFELTFTRYFKEKGFLYDSLVDTAPNDSIYEKNNFNQYVYLTNELLQKRGMPVLKKQQIAINTLGGQTQEHLYLALRHIEKNTGYDIGLIWENIIRTLDISDLQKKLCLQYVVDESAQVPNIEKQKALFIVQINYLNSYEYVTEKLQNLHNFFDVIIYTPKDEIAELYSAEEYEVIPSKRKCIEKAQNYDYVCVVRDEDMSSDEVPSYVGKSLFHRTWDNLARGREYVNAVIKLFEQHPYLGLLTPPNPNFGMFYGDNRYEWGEEYPEVKQRAERYGLQDKIKWDKPLFSKFDVFWVRGCILDEMMQWEDEDYKVLPYLLGYVAQRKGFYSGIVESREYASLNEINLQYYLSRLNRVMHKKYGEFDKLGELSDKIIQEELDKYCSKYEKIYVYGAGDEARYFSRYIKNIKSYVVTDGGKKEPEFCGHKVIYLSEAEIDDKVGMVILLNKSNTLQVVSLLENRGIHNYFCHQDYKI